MRPTAMDIRQALAHLQQVMGRPIGSEPITLFDGTRIYDVDGIPCTEAQILMWVRDGVPPDRDHPEFMGAKSPPSGRTSQTQGGGSRCSECDRLWIEYAHAVNTLMGLMDCQDTAVTSEPRRSVIVVAERQRRRTVEQIRKHQGVIHNRTVPL